MPETRIIYDIEDITAFVIVCKGTGCGNEIRVVASELNGKVECPKCKEPLAFPSDRNADGHYEHANQLLMALKDLANDTLPLRIRFETTVGKGSAVPFSVSIE